MVRKETSMSERDTALRALVGRWRTEAAAYPADVYADVAAAAVRLCADELAALLAEAERPITDRDMARQLVTTWLEEDALLPAEAERPAVESARTWFERGFEAGHWAWPTVDTPTRETMMEAAYRAEADPRASPAPCNAPTTSSGMCGYGTPSCTVDHGPVGYFARPQTVEPMPGEWVTVPPMPTNLTREQLIAEARKLADSTEREQSAYSRVLLDLADALASAQQCIQELEQERDRLADAIHPLRTDHWTVDQLAVLARAHREDSEALDRVEGEQDNAIQQVGGQMRQRIQELEQTMQTLDTDLSHDLSVIERLEQERDRAKLEMLDALEKELVVKHDGAKAERLNARRQKDVDGDSYHEGRGDAFGHALATIDILRASLTHLQEPQG